MTSVSLQALAPGTKLLWYDIHDVLGQGGFGITYLARDPNLRQRVAIKEYLPTELATRVNDTQVEPLTEGHEKDFTWGLQRFIFEAQTLSRFEHPNIVAVFSVFEMNKTAYMVMRYEDGSSLASMLTGNATLGESWLKKMVLPIIDGLGMVHAAGFIHRDIKPGNIYIREECSPVLLDFGSARKTSGDATRTLTTLVSPGYAPFEQYYAKSSKQGPWTDIYALGATLYRATTGRPPADALARSEALLGDMEDPYLPAMQAAGDRYSLAFKAAIDHALAFRESERPPDLASWDREIRGEAAVTPARADPAHRPPVEAVAATNRTQKRLAARRGAPKRSGRPWMAAAVVLLGAAAWVAAISVGDRGPAQPPDAIAALAGPPTPDGMARDDDFPPPDPLQPPPGDNAPTPNGVPPAAGASPSAAFAPPDAPAARNPVRDDSGSRERRNDVDGLLRAAWRDIGEQRYFGPGPNNAFSRLKRVLELDPGNSEALRGMSTLNAFFTTKARQAAGEGRRREAMRYARGALASAVSPLERDSSRRLVEKLRRTKR